MSSGKKLQRFEKLKSIERQYSVAAIATSALESALRLQPALLTNTGLGASDLGAFKADLIDTYFVRLFAEFETALKDHWKHGIHQDGGTRIMDVINSLASKYQVSEAVLIDVHAARRHRNRILHDRDLSGEGVAISSARRALNRFLGFLPDDW